MYRFSVLQFNEFMLELGALISFIPHMVNVEPAEVNTCPCLFRVSHCCFLGTRGGKI